MTQRTSSVDKRLSNGNTVIVMNALSVLQAYRQEGKVSGLRLAARGF